MPPTAVILDFDGVLADAENVHVVAWQRALSKLGWEVPDEVAARAATTGDRAFASDVFALRGIDDADLDGWVGEKRRLVAHMLGLDPRAFPGAAALVRALSGRARLAIVAPTARREDVDTFLAATGLADAFELVVAGEEATAPDALATALASLGVAPADATAVVASPAALAAAETAGLRRVAVGHRLGAGDWSAGAEFVPALEPPADALAALGFDDRSAS
ncbi:HAD family phosphatase [Paludisphaera sp.]|uniref:HAD family hydrolase n=1 Tax=Paludisphaera sp. TaxID=2017432 RepID=UPI00301C7D16